jgi:drug/metabolite transporter (DMT)-like permease
MRHAHIPTEAVLLIVASVFCFTLLDAITRFTARLYPVPVLVWARYVVQLVAMLVWLGPSMGLDLVRTRRLPVQIVRGMLLLLSSVFFTTALRHLQLAEATAIVYCTPVLVVLLALAFLRERMTRARLAFVSAGVAGMLLIVQPGRAVFQGASLFALGAAASFAVYQILTRVMAGENPRVLLFYPVLLGVLAMSLLAPTFDWPARVPWQHVALIVLSGLLAVLGHFLFILAFRHAPASALTPFTYVQLVWATLMGWVAYAEFPVASKLVGMAIIALSGLLIALHERRGAQRAVMP